MTVTMLAANGTVDIMILVDPNSQGKEGRSRGRFAR